VKKLTRLVALVAALGAGWLLFGERPHDVVLVYDVSAVPAAASVRIRISRGGTLLRWAMLDHVERAQARHPVRLPDGTYHLEWWVAPEVIQLHGTGGVAHGEREIEVSGDQTIVLSLAP